MLALDDLLALLSDRARTAEQAPCIDDDVVVAMAAAGINRAFVPAALGGDELNPAEVIAAVARISASDGSTGWCASTSAGGNLLSGYLPEGAARQMYEDPDVACAGVFASAGVVTPASTNGGPAAAMTGRWPFASNCLHSRWIALGAFVEDESGNRDPCPRLIFVPTADLVVEDTWRGAGLCATGSHHVRADAIAVDLARSCTFADEAWPEGPLWRMPIFSVLSPLLVSVMLGIARGAVDEVQRMIRQGSGGAERGRLADDPVSLAELAGADAALRAAYAGLLHLVEQVWQAGSTAGRATRTLQAQVMLAVYHAADVSVEATSLAHRLCGGAAAYTGHRVLTALRDVETARQHILFSHGHRPVMMRIAAGVDGIAPPFVL